MILIISTCAEKMHELEFVRPVEQIIGNNFFTKHYSKVSKKDINISEKIIICGTSLKDNQFMDNLNKFEFLKETDKPVLGICAGMEIIAKIFGGKIVKGQEIGLVRIKFKEEFMGEEGERDVYLLHNFAVKSVPNFKIFAKNKIIQAMKHKQKDIFGVMFHPEARQKEIIKSFIEL